MLPLILAVIICAVANEVVSWVVLIFAFVLSTLFAIRNVWSEPLADDEVRTEGIGIVGAVSRKPRSRG